MFSIEKHKVIIKNLHRIISNRYVFFNDGENDILLSGTNTYGNRILSAIVFDDDENDYLRYLNVLVDDTQYFQFINQELSLRSILETNESFFLVDYTYDGTEKSVNIISFNDLPPEFLPLKNSFCPKFTIEPSFEYSIGLKGNESDLHLARPDDLNDVNTKFSNFLESSLDFVDKFDFMRSVFVEAPIAGSFQLTFKINLGASQQLRLYKISQEQINNFINHLYGYIFHQLPKENNDVFTSIDFYSAEFKSVLNELDDLYQAAQVAPEDDVQTSIVNTINRSVKALKDINYDSSFNRIEFSNITKTGENIPIGQLNKEFIPSVKDKLHMLIDEPEEVIEDETPMEYQIRVYQFNTQTGNGSAFVTYDEDKLDRTIIHVRGKKNYENTKFTHSMDDGKIVTIRGLGIKINGKLKEIKIDLSEE